MRLHAAERQLAHLRAFRATATGAAFQERFDAAMSPAARLAARPESSGSTAAAMSPAARLVAREGIPAPEEPSQGGTLGFDRQEAPSHAAADAADAAGAAAGPVETPASYLQQQDVVTRTGKPAPAADDAAGPAEHLQRHGATGTAHAPPAAADDARSAEHLRHDGAASMQDCCQQNMHAEGAVLPAASIAVSNGARDNRGVSASVATGPLPPAQLADDDVHKLPVFFVPGLAVLQKCQVPALSCLP